MKLLEVSRKDKKLVRRFLDLPLKIYANDPEWIQPLDQDIEQVFDPKKNKRWRQGKAKRWILVNAEGEDIGRVAAYTNEKISKKENQPTGGMGFFECIDNQEAANILFEQCRIWLLDLGMEAMDGPINFGERDAWWGLLVDGFYSPVYKMNYHRPYYQKLFVDYGFQVYFKQFVYYRKVQDPNLPKFQEKYDNLMKDPGYHFTTVNKKQLSKYAEDFRTIYNNAWGGHAGFSKMDEKQAQRIMRQLRPILAPELAIFGYYKDEPIGFFISIPDMNQIFKDFKGKFGLIQKLRAWFRLRRRATKKCYGIVFGVVRQQQGQGVDGGLITAAAHSIHPQGHWDHLEMTWIGDFNPKMMRIAKDTGGEIYKTYHTMRYLFDRTIPFERLPLMESKGE
ncbi:MAG TPA: hypothetical protein ENJ82_16280 [Bacteroidetes bacterium]|nr:hypothetical protein [Bacteroidota bacterium]